FQNALKLICKFGKTGCTLRIMEICCFDQLDLLFFIIAIKVPKHFLVRIIILRNIFRNATHKILVNFRKGAFINKKIKSSYMIDIRFPEEELLVSEVKVIIGFHIFPDLFYNFLRTKIFIGKKYIL